MKRSTNRPHQSPVNNQFLEEPLLLAAYREMRDKPLQAEDSQFVGGLSPDSLDPLAGLKHTLEARANKLRMLLRPKQTRLRPPASCRRIYTEAELELATRMFHKLKHGEDRRPRPRPTAALRPPIRISLMFPRVRSILSIESPMCFWICLTSDISMRVISHRADREKRFARHWCEDKHVTCNQFVQAGRWERKAINFSRLCFDGTKFRA